ncbi:MAG: protein-ADP-ribose hydrolase [Clostridia bacterium]|nr:protein-ADP-ribose hydrolase [Clostridia bacterium]
MSRADLISYLLQERGEKWDGRLSAEEEKRLYRSLVNVRPPYPVSEEYLKKEDEYLQGRLFERGIVRLSDLTFDEDGIALWQGDITRLQSDAVVNAANKELLGCFAPCHACIDNCIHTYAGVRLRLSCDELMRAQGHDEPTGVAKITPAYNLPSKYVLHTVGPIVSGRLTEKNKSDLRSCYVSCLDLAVKNGLESVAFCCISTGVFGFPNDEAAKIAVRTVRDFKARTGSGIKVIFDVFKKYDYELYRQLLEKNR